MTNIQPDETVAPTVGGGVPIHKPPCYVAGTRIATPDGAVSVDSLTVGSLVLTASGDSKPVRWLGHRAFDCSKFRNPADVWPICIRAGAFAEGRPARDLWVSPGHALLMDGVLIQAANLVNGATIYQAPRDRIDYWHVELDRHEILLAEGLPAESYLDTGNRTDFVGGAVLEAYPDFKPKHWRDTCVPLVVEGLEISRAKSLLLARAAALGYVFTDDSDAHIMADGERIEAVRLSPNRLAFLVPAARSTIELRCRSFVPTQIDPARDDHRALGVCVSRLQLDGAEVALNDEASFSDGWHSLERTADGHEQRWSRDSAPLPAGTRLIVLDIASRSFCWASPVVEPAVQFG